MLDSEPVSWAGFSQVKATMRAISYALEENSSWSHFIPLSEQHLPTMSPISLDQVLRDRGSLVGARRVKQMAQWERVSVELRLALHYEELEGVGSFSKGMVAPDDDFLERLYHGSNWYILSRKHCAYLQQPSIKENYKKFAKSVHADEIAIQSLLWDATAHKIDTVENADSTFVAWPHLTDNPHMIFNEDNFWFAVANGLPFIRKRPDVLPESIKTYLDKTHHANLEGATKLLPALNKALNPKASYKEQLKAKIAEFIESSAAGSIEFYENILERPYLFAQVFLQCLHGLSIAILSDDLINFKIILLKQHEFEGFFLPYKKNDREVSLIIARVHGLFLQKDISVPGVENYGFIKIEGESDIDRLFSLLRQYIESAHGVGDVAL